MRKWLGFVLWPRIHELKKIPPHKVKCELVMISLSPPHFGFWEPVLKKMYPTLKRS